MIVIFSNKTTPIRCWRYIDKQKDRSSSSPNNYVMYSHVQSASFFKSKLQRGHNDDLFHKKSPKICSIKIRSSITDAQGPSQSAFNGSNINQTSSNFSPQTQPTLFFVKFFNNKIVFAIYQTQLAVRVLGLLERVFFTPSWVT